MEISSMEISNTTESSDALFWELDQMCVELSRRVEARDWVGVVILGDQCRKLNIRALNARIAEMRDLIQVCRD